MGHVLTIKALGAYPKIPIATERFKELSESKRILDEALRIEEKYDLLINNYLELESAVLRIAAEDMARPVPDYSDFFQSRQRLSNLFMNLFTAARLYVETLPSHVAKCCHDPDDSKTEIKRLLSEQYDSEFNYRLMEALRNHTQHSGSPVHSSTHVRQRVSGKDGDFIEYRLRVFCQRSVLAENRGFNKAILDEAPERVDLVLAARTYIGCLSTVHGRARDRIKSRVDGAREALEQAINEYAQVYKEAFVGLYAIAEDGDESQSVVLLLDWDNERRALQKKNPPILRLAVRYPSGRTSGV